MQKDVLQFIDGASLTRDGPHIGVTLNGNTQWARNAIQANIIRQVLCAPRNPETFSTELAKEHDLPHGSTEAMLHVLTFILDYKDFLQPQ